MLSPVRWKGSLTWNQMLLRLLFNPLPTQRATLLALLSSCPSSQKRYLHISEKEDPIMNRSCAKHKVARVLPQRGAHVSEGCIFFCHVDVSFLIYRIFFKCKKLH